MNRQEPVVSSDTSLTATSVPPRGSRALVLGIAGVATLVAIGALPKWRDHQARAEALSELAKPKRVRVTQVAAGAPFTEILLSGTAAPLHSTLLYAKSSGYLRRNLVDVGDKVEAGKRLAEIDVRDVDQDVILAEARLQEAKSNVGIVLGTAERQGKLAETGVTSRQQADDAQAMANSAKATLRTREAELQRLRAVRAYQEIFAPYDAVVTRRGFDPGALVGPQSIGGAALFELADTRRLRVVLDIPQNLATGVVAGLDAAVYTPDAPKNLYAGKVMRTAAVLDAGSRTLRTEIELPGEGLVPGSFVYAKLKVPRASSPPVIPAAALLIRKEGSLVAIVGADQKVRLSKVTLGRDMGKELEALAGVQPGETLVLNGGDDLNDGAQVEVAKETK